MAQTYFWPSMHGFDPTAEWSTSSILKEEDIFQWRLVYHPWNPNEDWESPSDLHLDSSHGGLHGRQTAGLPSIPIIVSNLDQLSNYPLWQVIGWFPSFFQRSWKFSPFLDLQMGKDRIFLSYFALSGPAWGGERRESNKFQGVGLCAYIQGCQEQGQYPHPFLQR